MSISRVRSILAHLQKPTPVTGPRYQHQAMSTFNLPDWNPACPVKLTDNLRKDQLLSFIPFKTWTRTLKHSLQQQEHKGHAFHDSPYLLRSIDIQSVDFFGGGSRLGFIKLTADVSNGDGEKLPGSVFLRGGSVAMLVYYSHPISTVEAC